MKKYNIRKKPVKYIVPLEKAHNTEVNAFHAGRSAFKIFIPFFNNPYRDMKCKAAWTRGYIHAQKLFNEAVKQSRLFQETLPLEEVDG